MHSFVRPSATHTLRSESVLGAGASVSEVSVCELQKSANAGAVAKASIRTASRNKRFIADFHCNSSLIRVRTLNRSLCLHLQSRWTNYLPTMPGVIKTHETALQVTSHHVKARLENTHWQITGAENSGRGWGVLALRFNKTFLRLQEASYRGAVIGIAHRKRG